MAYETGFGAVSKKRTQKYATFLHEDGVFLWARSQSGMGRIFNRTGRMLNDRRPALGDHGSGKKLARYSVELCQTGSIVRWGSAQRQKDNGTLILVPRHFDGA
jgi:hypothetical protein